MIVKLPKMESKWVFLVRKAKMLFNKVLKQPIDPFRLLSQKMPKISTAIWANIKVKIEK